MFFSPKDQTVDTDDSNIDQNYQNPISSDSQKNSLQNPDTQNPKSQSLDTHDQDNTYNPEQKAELSFEPNSQQNSELAESNFESGSSSGSDIQVDIETGPKIKKTNPILKNKHVQNLLKFFKGEFIKTNLILTFIALCSSGLNYLSIIWVTNKIDTVFEPWSTLSSLMSTIAPIFVGVGIEMNKKTSLFYREDK